MGNFNSIGQFDGNLGGSIPVWCGVVSPVPAGGVLASRYAVKGLFVPAGSPVYYDDANRKIYPLAFWKVVSVDSTTHAITVEENVFGIAPKADDIIGIIGATFATTSAAGKVSAVAAGTTAGQIVITFTDGKLDGASVGSYLTFSAASAVATSGASMAYQPNAYLYNDICIDGLFNKNVNASGAVVKFHGEGLLIDRTKGSAFASQLAAAIPTVILVKG